MAPRRFPIPDVRAEPRAVEVDGSELTRRTAASPREEEDARANRARGAIGDAAADDTDMARVAMNVAGRPPATESAASGARASKAFLCRESEISDSAEFGRCATSTKTRLSASRGTAPGPHALARTPASRRFVPTLCPRPRDRTPPRTPIRFRAPSGRRDRSHRPIFAFALAEKATEKATAESSPHRHG